MPAEARSLVSRFVQAGDIRTHLWEGGSQHDPTLLLVHDGGYGSDAQLCWGKLLELLSEHFHVLAPDLTGFGRTDKVYRFDQDPFIQRVHHLRRLLEVMEVLNAFMVGASFGGAVVLRAALERLPPLTRAVTISGTGGLFFVQEKFAELQTYSPSQADAKKIWELLAVGTTEQQIDHRYRISLIPGHWETLSAARLRNPAAEPTPDRLPLYREALAGIQIPVLLIAGKDDPLLEPGWEEKMATIIPGSVARQVAGTRHEPHVDQPEEVARILVEFLT